MTFTLSVEALYTISDIRAKIQDQEGCPLGFLCLTFKDELLKEGCTLSDYGIMKGSILNMVRSESVPAYVRSAWWAAASRETTSSASILKDG